MEEPVHYMLMLIQLVDGTYIQKLAEVFKEPMTLIQCLDYGDVFREKVSTYVYEQDGKILNRHIMNDGSGNFFGIECVQDPNKMN